MRPIFITGYERSGTTLLRRLVSMHPDVKYDLVHEDKKNLMKANNRAHALELMTYPATQAGKKIGSMVSIRAGIKIPYVGFAQGKDFIDKFRLLYPDGRIIHVARNPVGAVNSQVKTFNKNPDQCIKDYFDNVPRMTSYLGMLHDVCTVRYEDFIDDSESAVFRLYEWIGGEVSKDHITKVIGTKDPWESDGRTMCGLRYGDSLGRLSEITLAQKYIDNISTMKLRNAK